MKTNQLLLAVAVISLLSACGKDPQDNSRPKPEPKPTKTVSFKVSAENLPVQWNAGQIALSVNYGAVKTVDLSAGSFSLDLEESGAPYTFIASAPAQALAGKLDAASNSAEISVPNSQKPLADGPDELANVLVAASSSYSELPTEAVELKLNPAVAYGKLLISGIKEKISKVNLTFNDNVTGTWLYSFSDKAMSVKKGSKVIALNTAELTGDVVWFAIAPQTISSVTVEAFTGESESMTIDVPVELSPKAGEVFEINAEFVIFKHPSLNGSNYYPMIMDNSVVSYLGDKVAFDCRPNDVNKFFYIWGDTYGGKEPEGTGFYGQEGGFMSLFVKDERWWSAGALYIKPESGVDLKAIGADPSNYYFHMAFKGTATPHMIGITNGTERYDFVVGVGTFSDHGVTASALTPVSGAYVPDEWNEYEFPISTSGVDFSKDLVNDGDGGCNILIALSGPTITGDGPVALVPAINMDAVFIYKK